MAKPQLDKYKCGKCKDTALIPLKRKDGSVVPYAWLFCECYEEEPEHYHPVRPEDFDFPISYSYYRSLCQYHGWADPGSDVSPESDTREVEQVKADLLNLQAKVGELVHKKTVAKQGTKYTIK